MAGNYLSGRQRSLEWGIMTMIDDVYCYTWIDILDRLRSDAAMESAPDCLVTAEPLSNRVMLSVTYEAEIQTVNAWLSSVFGPRFEPDRNAIRLDSPRNGRERRIPVDIERLDPDEEVARTIKLRPSVSRGRSVIYHPAYELPVDRNLSDAPPIFTFHSSKGGMGRTTIALALSFSLTKQNRRVLLVDADFEAPGISGLLKTIMPSPKIALADLIALAHSDPDPNANDALELVAERLLDQTFESMFILPCTRDLGPPLVTPDALTISSRRSAFFMGELLGRLGRKLGVDVVLVDLRAGMSELVASLFLDPRLQHVLVTTLNGQAIDGTLHLLEALRGIAKKWTDSTGQRLKHVPYVIVNQRPTDGAMVEAANIALADLEEKLYSKFQEIGQIGTELTDQGSEDNPFLDRSLAPIVIDRLSSISILPSDLEKVRDRLMASDLPSLVLDVFLSDLPPAPTAIPQEPPIATATLRERRKALANFARDAIYAESGMQSGIFPTRSLSKLVSNFRTELPNVVILGDKGAGKTYTFMSIALSGRWLTFANRVMPDHDGQTDAEIVPVLLPGDLALSRKTEISQSLRTMAASFGGGLPLNDASLVDLVQDFMSRPEAKMSGAWRAFWLDVIAQRCGFTSDGHSTGIELLSKALKNRNSRIVAMFDGLETLFQQFNSEKAEQAALEALLRQVPDWLAQMSDRAIGLIVFVRQDLARAALPMNFGQFQGRYEPYALRWNWSEAAALALWTAQQAGAVEKVVNPAELVGMDEEERATTLIPLWGWKLGSDDSNEARTLEWVTSSLSNFRAVLQARDLVRFIAIAAEKSNEQDSFSADRILTPRAVRDSIEPCSEYRVKETGEENPELNSIFKKISGMSHDMRELPWSSRDAAVRLDDVELKSIIDFGVFFRDNDEYFVPEIYRSGLRLLYPKGARRRVVTLMRRARAQQS